MGGRQGLKSGMFADRHRDKTRYREKDEEGDSERDEEGNRKEIRRRRGKGRWIRRQRKRPGHSMHYKPT